MPPRPAPVFRRIETKDPVLSQLQDSIVDAIQRIAYATPASDISSPRGGMDTSKPLYGVPVGMPFPILRHLFAKNFSLWPNVVACDGRTIKDPESPLNGKTIPNINGNRWFLRGDSSTGSGTTETADAVVPAHAHDLNGHTHTAAPATVSSTSLSITPNPHTHALSTASGPNSTTAVTAVGNNGSGNVAPTSLSITPNPHNHTLSGSTGGPTPSVTATDGGSGAETRPKNLSLYFVVRIK